jgi:glyoxylase-like metal-dependent hydrolase (beta-lactamase superfamily II)
VTKQAPALCVGDIKIWPLKDGVINVPRPGVFPEEGTKEFEVHKEYVHGDRWTLHIGGYLVQSHDRLMLIDAGAGPSDGTTFRPAPIENIEEIPQSLAAMLEQNGVTDPDQIRAFLARRGKNFVRVGSLGESLSDLGFRPTDVTDVLISHLHFDHIGWVSKDDKPYFPNAVVRCEEKDAEYFLAPSPGTVLHDELVRQEYNGLTTPERMAPVLDRLETWTENQTIAPGVEAIFSPGHTPGSAIFSITSGHDRALILGDAVHCVQELIDPAFSRTYRQSSDHDIDEADLSRELIRKRAVDESAYISAAHFPGFRFGRLTHGDRPNSWHFSWADDATGTVQ